MVSDLEYLYDIYKHKKYNSISERNMDIELENVQKVIKKGRVLILCSCQNHSKFCNSPAMCRHKLFFLVFPLFENYDKKLKEFISFLKINKNLSEKSKLNMDEIITQLEELRKVK
ncbi:MAG TPA: hypothetical protein VGB37_14665 [Candidatus Lokiarchaeia archaeon]